MAITGVTGVTTGLTVITTGITATTDLTATTEVTGTTTEGTVTTGGPGAVIAGRSWWRPRPRPHPRRSLGKPVFERRRSPRSPLAPSPREAVKSGRPRQWASGAFGLHIAIETHGN